MKFARQINGLLYSFHVSLSKQAHTVQQWDQRSSGVETASVPAAWTLDMEQWFDSSDLLLIKHYELINIRIPLWSEITLFPWNSVKMEILEH